MSRNLSLASIQGLLAVSAGKALIQQPASAVEGGTALYDDEAVFNNQDLIILASAARTTSANGADRTNQTCRGFKLVIDMTAVPGVDTVTFTVQGKDPASGKYYTLLASGAIVAASTVVLSLYPALTAAANAVANDILPRTFRVITTHSAASSFTYSVGMILIR